MNMPKYITLAHLTTTVSALLNKIEEKADISDLSDVAFSGSYTDLINKPDFVNTATFEAVVADYLSFQNTASSTITEIYSDMDSIIPSQTGNSGKFLTTNGTTLSWVVLPIYDGTVVNGGGQA